MKSFVRKNDLGVSIEYTIVGTYKEDDNTEYIIYTDFLPDDTSPVNIKLYVEKNEGNNKYVDVDDAKRKEIIDKMHETFEEQLSN